MFGAMRFVILTLCLSFGAGQLGPAYADNATCPMTDVILQIEFVDTETQVTHIRDVTLQDLDVLPQSSFHTTTIWTDGQQRFEGVSMAVLLHSVGVSDGHVTLHAINDYHVTAAVSDLTERGALLATRRNGRLMTVRSNGPLWLVWNYDADPALRTESIYALSIWQLDRITISR